MKYYILAILLVITIVVAIYAGHITGALGGFYIEQKVYEGQPATWLWHNGKIAWSHCIPLSEFSDSTFIKDRATAQEVIEQIKKAEAEIH